MAVGYSPCLTMRPRSSTSVLRPFSVSSLAAHPPLIPEPTTIASNEFDSMLPLWWCRVCKTSKCAKFRLHTQDVLHTRHRHYEPPADSPGSVHADQPDAGGGVPAAVHGVRFRGLVRAARDAAGADLGAQVLL